VVPLHSTEAHLGDRRYSSYSFLTSALEGGEWSASQPGRPLPPGKEPPVPIVQEAGWAPEPVWAQRLEEKSSASVGGTNPGRPVHSQTLYWLSYPAPKNTDGLLEILCRWILRNRHTRSFESHPVSAGSFGLQWRLFHCCTPWSVIYKFCM
jgi:hypothetical protein